MGLTMWEKLTVLGGVMLSFCVSMIWLRYKIDQHEEEVRRRMRRDMEMRRQRGEL